MKHIHFDSVGGASGDMILAALIDLGVNRDALQAQLAGLKIGSFAIEATAVSERGLHGTRVNVRLDQHAHPHTEEDHAHQHAHAPHRGLKEIRALIGGSALPEKVKANSLRVFQRLAEAEAAVHGTTPDEIHFHEVGAVDAIVDIVGACLGLDMLAVTGVSFSPLPLGHGTVKCAHGILPVPAPATAQLLKNFAVAPSDEPFELVTPTGAALLTTWKTAELFPAGAVIKQIGQAFGHHHLQARPNLLRAMLMEINVPAALETALVMECNLDDLTPELAGALQNRLLAAGALDVFITPVHMKKQRPGILLTVLSRIELHDVIRDIIFRESTTFGIREYPVQRTILERRHEVVETGYGAVRIKIGSWQGEDITALPEYDDCLQAAGSAGVPLRVVYEAALGKIRQHTDEPKAT